MSDSSAPDDEHEALQALVSERLGYPVIYVNSKELTQNNVPGRSRRYRKHVFRRKRPLKGKVIVFAKSGMSPSQTDSSEPLQYFLSGAHSDEFRAPFYFGTLNWGRNDWMNNLGVWEYVAREKSVAPAREWIEARDKVVLAAASMTAVTEAVRQAVPRLRANVHFLRPLAATVNEALENYAKRGQDTARLAANAARLAALEGPALRRLESFGSYFTHNDYRYHNMFLKAGDRPVIFDWDTASFGPPGATLRIMTRLKEPELVGVVNLYCSYLTGKGLSLREEDVLFTIRAAEVFHALAHGAKYLSKADDIPETLFRWGLDHLAYLAT